MKKKLFFFIILPILIWGQVIETNQMSDILHHVDSETWVIFDVDNTLIESSLHLGSAQWRGHIRKKALDLGYSDTESERILDNFWKLVQPLIPVRLVDKETESIVKQLQEDKVATMALTAREPDEVTHTEKQLKEVHISLSNDFLKKDFSLSTPYPGLLKNSVVYCGENKKSEALLTLFKELDILPKKVVFIDDKWDQIYDVEKILSTLGIEYICIRFSGADARVASFNSEIADLQWGFLPKIISDQEAMNGNFCFQADKMLAKKKEED